MELVINTGGKQRVIVSQGANVEYEEKLAKFPSVYLKAFETTFFVLLSSNIPERINVLAA